MPKQCVLTLVAVSASVLLFAAEANAAKGTVTHKMSGCDYFIVETPKGYDLLEWYGGHDPDRGDVLVGEFESYGIHDIYDDTIDEELTVWVEDYDLSKGNALENLVEQCE
jgi:hypothetical protein